MFPKPAICLVTDRHRLCAGCDAAQAAARLLTQIREAVAAGVDLIQIRERDLEASALAALAADAVALARGTATRIVVNDRLDVAMAAGAAGVHLRADSIAPAAARRLAPAGFLVGRSVHNPDEPATATDADYLIAGAVFRTVSKPDPHGALGEAGLAAVVRASRAPVLAIGGVTLERLPAVAAAGASGFAAIGFFIGDVPLSRLVAAARAQFDSAKTGP
jgi:thiamine-phosphate pyrophosphorylase